jgi:D-glycero-D-manno-heptose 1,7-bisphosphate phosphatase
MLFNFLKPIFVKYMGNKAVFLDRDGVLITERGEYNYLPEHLDIVEGTVEALSLLQSKGYLLIVITNQGGIAKGMYTHAQVNRMHGEIRDFYKSFGVRLAGFYYCPHHSRHGLCICRKPDSLMLEKAIAANDIDAAQSWFIGDNARDVDAGHKAGVRTILIPSNADLRDFISVID